MRTSAAPTTPITRRDTFCTSAAGATKFRSFLQFDVSRLAGASISKAYLRLYNSFVPAADCGKNPWFGAYRVDEPWNQCTITWANQPAVGDCGGEWFGVGIPRRAARTRPTRTCRTTPRASCASTSPT
ncbi:DNRLRE domain-containing protein [Streptomyces sp. NPDC056549]|uniref:DNRLRE domain-containing protein n=1 Tax=Streptomyces sp. NPDC056549 TaxID=3345864 RepID=UPI00367A1D2C